MMREEYCPACGMPIYRAADAATYRPVDLDWWPVSYGAHLVRQGKRTFVVPGPAPDGAHYLLDMETGACRHALPIVHQTERMIYRQAHAATCGVWLGQVFARLRAVTRR